MNPINYNRVREQFPERPSGENPLTADQATAILERTRIEKHVVKIEGKKDVVYYSLDAEMTTADKKTIRVAFTVDTKDRSEVVRFAETMRVFAKQFTKKKLNIHFKNGAVFSLKKEGGENSFKLVYTAAGTASYQIFAAGDSFGDTGQLEDFQSDQKAWVVNLDAPVKGVNGLNGEGYFSNDGNMAKLGDSFTWKNFRNGLVNGIRSIDWNKKSSWALAIAVTAAIMFAAGTTGLFWLVAIPMVPVVRILGGGGLYGAAKEMQLHQAVKPLFQRLLITVIGTKMGGAGMLYSMYNDKLRPAAQGMLAIPLPKIDTYANHYIKRIETVYEKYAPEEKKKDIG